MHHTPSRLAPANERWLNCRKIKMPMVGGAGVRGSAKGESEGESAQGGGVMDVQTSTTTSGGVIPFVDLQRQRGAMLGVAGLSGLSSPRQRMSPRFLHSPRYSHFSFHFFFLFFPLKFLTFLITPPQLRPLLSLPSRVDIYPPERRVWPRFRQNDRVMANT